MLKDTTDYAHIESEVMAEIRDSMAVLSHDEKKERINAICEAHGIPQYHTFACDMRRKYIDR